MPEPWQKELDSVLGGIARLNDALVSLPKEEAGQVGTRLRQANRTVWSIINTLEAHQVEHLYDMHSLIRKLAEKHEQDIPELWIQLIEGNVLKLNPKALIELARKNGIDVSDYTKEKEE